METVMASPVGSRPISRPSPMMESISARPILTSPPSRATSAPSKALNSSVWSLIVCLQFVKTDTLESRLPQQAVGAEVHGLHFHDGPDQVEPSIPVFPPFGVCEAGAHTQLSVA